MKISVQWLNSYLDTPAEVQEIEWTLTQQGLPIEGRAPLGQGVGDVVLDVEVTSNRSDCLSHLGLAREVAAGTNRSVVAPCSPEGPDEDGQRCVEACAAVVNQDASLCPLYTARVIEGVSVGPSPDWLVGRLTSVGLRSVNNVVDVTNFVLLELGQPLHAFDLDTLDQARIVVRPARRGESMVAIDGSQYVLHPDMLVIADARKPVAVAGVMGGPQTGVTEKTTRILLEAAVFDPSSVRRTSRALRLASDSSYRFERGVDPQGVDAASRRAAAMIRDLAGGVLARGVLRAGGQAPGPRTLTMRPDRCNQLLGLRLGPQQMVQPLDRLGFQPRLDQTSGRITCTVPTYRLDVRREVDLIEEVCRLHGFDAIPVNEKIHIVAAAVPRAVQARRRLGQVLVAHGYHEAVSFTFVSPRFGQPFVREGCQPVMIDDAQRRPDPMLRPSILPSLLACRKSNQDAGNAAVRLFECAATWTRRQGQIVERNCLAMLQDAPDIQHGLRRVRGVIGELAHELAGSSGLNIVPAQVPHFSVAALVSLDGRPLGWMGAVDSSCQELFDLQSPVIAAELDLDTLLERFPPVRRVEPPPRFPGIGRDLTVVVDEPVRWAQIQEHVITAAPKLLEDVVFLGVYRGQPITAGKKSVSFRVLFRDPEGTMRHEQVDPQIAAVVERLEIQLGAQLRA